MRKYKKKEIHMIDMSRRLEVKIIHETVRDDESWQKEMELSEQRIEKQMIEYENHIRSLFNEALSQEVLFNSEEQSDYFIKKYGEKFIGRNFNNVRNRMELYNKYLKEQEN